VAKRKGVIFDDPRYALFVERYHADPLRFAVEVCGLIPSADQEDLLYAIIAPDAKASVVSGTGTGKTTVIARIALWHMLCHPVAIYEGKVEIGSNTYIGAPKLAQVVAGAWKELQDTRLAIGSGEFGWINDYYTISKTKVYVNGFDDQWFISQVALAPGESVGIAGKHRYFQMIIVDEAAGVPDTHFDVIDGTQTQEFNRTILLSQGVHNTGRFYDSHHTLSVDNGGSWTSLTFSSENSPFVTTEWLRNRAIETGGRDSVEYQIRVLGRFPEQADKYLTGRSQIESRIGASPTIRDDEAYGHVIVIDVGAGVYRDRTVATHFKVCGTGDRLDPDPRRVDVVDVPVYSNSLDWTDVAGRVIDYARTLSNVTMVVDVGGQGEQFARLLERTGVSVIVRCNWGKTNFKAKYKDRFFNQRAQCSVHASESVKDGRISFTEHNKKDLLDQGSRIPYHFDEKARYHIMPKEKMAEEGLRSPDFWDTVCMVFHEEAHYIPAESASAVGAMDRKEQALASAMAELEGIGQ
jgi:hypothetical protein